MASYTNRGTKKKPAWQFTISHMVNGKSKPIRKGGFKSKGEAQVAAGEVEAELRKGIVPNLTEIPLSEYFESWIKTFKTDIANNTLERYKTSQKTVQDYFGDKPIQKLTKREYQAFLNDYGKTHTKASTRKLNTHIRSCVREAVDEGLIRVDFTRAAVLTGKDGKAEEKKYINYEESEKLLNALFERLPTGGIMNYLLLLGLTSGMRFAELVGITREDFNFFNNTITVNKTWGYTRRMPEGFGTTKTDQSVRVITVNSKTMKAFNKLFQSTPDNIFRLVFYSPKSRYKVLSNNAANKALGQILESLGIDIISVHGLRHTHASVLLFKRVDAQYVAERLGHSGTETLHKTYAHIFKELRQRDEKRSAEIFEKMSV